MGALLIIAPAVIIAEPPARTDGIKGYAGCTPCQDKAFKRDVISLHLLANHVGVQMNCDVDQPRKILKSVTVE